MTLQIIVDPKLDHYFTSLLNKRFATCAFPAELNPADTRTIAYVDVSDGSFSEDDVLAIVAFNRWTEYAVDVTLITNGAKRAKTSREFNWTVFDYAFNHAGMSRINAYVAVSNDKSIAIVEDMLGFKREAVLEDYLGPGNDAYLYGLTKAQWQNGKWADWRRVH